MNNYSERGNSQCVGFLFNRSSLRNWILLFEVSRFFIFCFLLSKTIYEPNKLSCQKMIRTNQLGDEINRVELGKKKN